MLGSLSSMNRPRVATDSAEGLVRDVEHRRQLDRFEEHRVQRVVLVDVLHHVRVLQDLVDDVHLSAKVVWILGGGEVLQHAHALHLQPR